MFIYFFIRWFFKYRYLYIIFNIIKWQLLDKLDFLIFKIVFHVLISLQKMIILLQDQSIKRFMFGILINIIKECDVLTTW